MRRFLALALAASIASPSAAQHAGEFRVGVTFGLPSKTGLSLRYYVVDGVGVELHGHVFGWLHTGAYLGAGAALNVHPNPEEPYYVVANYAYTLFSRPGAWPPSPDSPDLNVKRSDLALGVGAELASDRDSLYLSGALGLNINLRRTVRVPGPEHRLVDGPSTRWKLRPFLEAGLGFRTPEEEDAQE